jgi:hypothetical protein
MTERRAVPRLELQKPLPARVKTFLPARIVDISPRGAQLELGTSLRPQVPCDLRIQLEGGDIVVHGMVRRCRAWGFGLDEKDQHLVTIIDGDPMDYRVLKYNGRPFSQNEVFEGVKEAIKNGTKEVVMAHA